MLILRFRQRKERERAQFEIGDDDDEDGDQPPCYDEISPSDLTKLESQTPLPSEQDQHGDHIAEQGEEFEMVEIKHRVSRSDTLLFIARRYAADVSPTLPFLGYLTFPFLYPLEASRRPADILSLTLASRPVNPKQPPTHNTLNPPTPPSNSSYNPYISSVSPEIFVTFQYPLHNESTRPRPRSRGSSSEGEREADEEVSTLDEDC